MSRRKKPSDPQTIMLRRAQLAAAEREAAKDPTTWGIDPAKKTLPASRSVKTIAGARGSIAHARRLDAFDALHAIGGLTDGQHQAAQLLIKSWAEMLGIAGRSGAEPLDKVDSQGAAELVTQRMVDARARVERALGAVGAGTARLLVALVEPIVLEGSVSLPDQVRRITGEVDLKAQRSLVRMSCENLRDHFRIGPPANDNRPSRLHPFHAAPPDVA
jgi:hypothetical protein